MMNKAMQLEGKMVKSTLSPVYCPKAAPLGKSVKAESNKRGKGTKQIGNTVYNPTGRTKRNIE